MSAPCVLVATCCDDCHPSTIVKQILSVDELPAGTPELEEIHSYPWRLDTKYYTADVSLCTTNTRTIGDQHFAERVEAFIVYFNGNQRVSFNQVKSWIPFLKEIDPEVKMLVCQRSLHTDDIPRHMVQEWCLDYQFELVELDPESEDQELEDDYPDSFGITRILQALQAHTWSNLVMKEEPDIRSPYLTQLMREQESEVRLILQADNAVTQENDAVARQNDAVARENETVTQENDTVTQKNNTVTQENDTVTPENDTVTPDAVIQKSNSGTQADPTSTGVTADPTSVACAHQSEGGTSTARTACQGGTTDNKESPSTAPIPKDKSDILDSLLSSDDVEMFNALAQDEPDGESFEKLFTQLKVMKDLSAQLPPDQRKQYAEKMAVSFWRSIGGDEDEIANLSDSSND